jgi:hypothetical protein
MGVDEFIQIENCIERLLREYNTHKKLIIAFDFDDTVFDYHRKGGKNETVLALLRRCQQLGFWLVMFTASAPERFPEMIQYMQDQGIEVHSVNKNPINLPFGYHGKIYYNILLDDRAGLGQAVETLTAVLDRISEHPK